jgi:hypothetical protein
LWGNFLSDSQIVDISIVSFKVRGSGSVEASVLRLNTFKSSLLEGKHKVEDYGEMNINLVKIVFSLK